MYGSANYIDSDYVVALPLLGDCEEEMKFKLNGLGLKMKYQGKIYSLELDNWRGLIVRRWDGCIGWELYRIQSFRYLGSVICFAQKRYWHYKTKPFRKSIAASPFFNGLRADDPGFFRTKVPE